MGNIVFFICCAVISISLQPISDKVGLTEFLSDPKRCSDLTVQLITGTIVFVILTVVSILFLLTRSLNQ
jgi:hypothetical protein